MTLRVQRVATALLLSLANILFESTAASALSVPLTVTNREPAARTAEPLTSGVPFAEGVVTDVGRLRLLQGSTEIPSQFLVTARWPDGSVRWVLVDTQVDLPASGPVFLTIETGAAPAAVSGITVTDASSTLTVDTLGHVFTFTKTEFVVGGHAFQVHSCGAAYLAVPTSWTVEESGPMKVVVRVDGVWRGLGAPLVNDLNRFRARLVFFRNRRDVRVFLTFRNNNSYGWDQAGGGQLGQDDVLVSSASFGPATLLAAGGPYHIGSGIEKTWEVVVGDDGTPVNRVTRFGADGSLVSGDAAPRPLAAAPASYYASTRAWGTIGLPVTGQAADRQADFDRFERIQRAKVDRTVLENPPGLTGITVWGHLSQDLSSWNDYGDLRWVGNGCGTLSSNHYDWSFGMFLQFMRTGLIAFADLARVMARHEIDFDVYHTAADSPAFNYQKNWEDRPSHNNPGNCFGGGRPSHTWSQGYALLWLLTGDRRGKDAFDEVQEGVRQYLYESFNGEGYVNTSELRIQGWLIENLVNLWRINPDATLATSSYGSKMLRVAIRDVLQNVIDREMAAGHVGFVVSEDDASGHLRQTLVHAYFLEPAIKAYHEVYAGRDAPYAATLLGLVRRMTTWLVGTVYGGDTGSGGTYRPRQIPYWVDTRLSAQTDGQLPYLLMAANAAGFLYTATTDAAWRDQARTLFQDYVRYVGAIGPDSYGDPTLRTPASYNSNIFPGTESKIQGWFARYGQYYLAAESGSVGATTTIGASPSGLRFAATKFYATSDWIAVTPSQVVTVNVSGGSTAWTATADQDWVRVTNGTGNNNGQFTVAIVTPSNLNSGATGATATITITPASASAAAATVSVTLSIAYSIDNASPPTAAPFGVVDTPPQNAADVTGSIAITGWALDDVGVAYVKIYRDCLAAFEPAANCRVVDGVNLVYLGTATFVPGARPDVEAAYPTAPQPYRGGWGYLMLTNLLPHVPGSQMFGGQGGLTLYFIATDQEGQSTFLGRSPSDHTPTAIILNNDAIAKPFGAIDTPGQGETVSGTVTNFGWALTPDSNSTAEPGDILIPTNGSTMWVFLDGAPVAPTVTYNQCRGNNGSPTSGWYCNDDVANIYGNTTPQALHTARASNPTKFRNLDEARAAIGSFTLNTTTLSNGLHQIVWSVTDTASRTEGIGSRYFTVLNSGNSSAGVPDLHDPAGSGRPALGAATGGQSDAGQGFLVLSDIDGSPGVIGRTGFDLRAPLEAVAADAEGVRHVQLPPLGRLELWLGPVEAGYLVAAGTMRDLPVGSRLDPATGRFTWTPGPAFFGRYDLVFVGGGTQVPVSVTIQPFPAPGPGDSAVRMHVDAPAAGGTERGRFLVAGWALDPQAAFGAGIGAVHVWAQRRDLPGAAPEFLGEAALGGARPDVAAVHGARFHAAGFGLNAPAMAPGEYDVQVFVWSARTARWEDAQTVAVTVR